MAWRDVPDYVKNNWANQQETIRHLREQARDRWRDQWDRDLARAEAQRMQTQLDNAKANYGIYPKPRW